VDLKNTLFMNFFVLGDHSCNEKKVARFWFWRTGDSQLDSGSRMGEGRRRCCRAAWDDEGGLNIMGTSISLLGWW